MTASDYVWTEVKWKISGTVDPRTAARGSVEVLNFDTD